MPENKPIQIEFESNTLLQDLCGRHDSHLQQIEEQLGVQLVARGNQMAIFGPEQQSEIAKVVLEDLYGLLQKGLPISAPQVEAALRVSNGLLKNGEASLGSGRPADVMNEDAGIVTPKQKIMPRSGRQHAYIAALRSNVLTFGLGPAGTGKTFLATAFGASLLVSGEVKKLILTRPVVEAGEHLGFLPGTFEEKIDPYLRPFFDALHMTLGREKTEKMRTDGSIEIAPLAYMRGRTLSDCVMILDEAQNTSPAQMKMFLTRLGENSRMIVTGDPSQCDLPKHLPSGLKDAVHILEGLSEIATIRFTEADVVRHRLVSRIVTAYDERDRQEVLI